MSPEETCVSGQSDIDYPSLSTAFPALKTMPFISDVNHVPIPKEVLHEFESNHYQLIALLPYVYLTKICSVIPTWV
jgi:hypothetical protein